MKKLLFTLSVLFIGITAYPQGYAFGIKGGLTVGFQQWDASFQNDPLYRYHAILYTESLSEDNEFGLFAQGGYHVKGSAIRTYGYTIQLPGGGFRTIPAYEIPFEFRNISVTLGGKRKYDLGVRSKWYYLLGIRGDYTLSTKLRPDFIDQNDPFALYYPVEMFVKKINYGVTFGGGIELMFSDLVGGLLELSVNPDFSRQYNQPPLENIIVPNPNGGPSTTTIPAREIRNLTLELTLGIRLLRKIEYIDE